MLSPGQQSPLAKSSWVGVSQGNHCQIRTRSLAMSQPAAAIVRFRFSIT